MKKLATITMGKEVVHVEIEVRGDTTDGTMKADAIIALYKNGIVKVEIDHALGNVIELPKRIQ